MKHPEDFRNEGSSRIGGLLLFAAFVGGALAGGAAALLLAPCSGAETRRRIAGATRSPNAFGARVPLAFREASSAAQAAFAASLKASAPTCTTAKS
jgi:gas vesicle protein